MNDDEWWWMMMNDDDKWMMIMNDDDDAWWCMMMNDDAWIWMLMHEYISQWLNCGSGVDCLLKNQKKCGVLLWYDATLFFYSLGYDPCRFHNLTNVI